MNNIFKKIAKENNFNENEIRNEIENIIDETYINPTELALKVPHKNEKPTVDEFIDFAVQQVIQKLYE